MLGYNQDEILQMSFFDVEAPLQKRKFTQIQKPEPKEIEKVNIRLTLQRKDNSTFISEVTSKKSP